MMNYTALEAEISNGQISVSEPERLPDRGRGLLILFPESVPQPRKPVVLPLIKSTGNPMINPTPEELDGSLWD
jgi:hypothetical protein